MSGWTNGWMVEWMDGWMEGVKPMLSKLQAECSNQSDSEPYSLELKFLILI